MSLAGGFIGAGFFVWRRIDPVSGSAATLGFMVAACIFGGLLQLDTRRMTRESLELERIRERNDQALQGLTQQLIDGAERSRQVAQAFMRRKKETELVLEQLGEVKIRGPVQ